MTNSIPIKALIRDAGGLTIYERVFLHTIDSHDGRKMYASVKSCCRHMSMCRAMFYKTRDCLIEKGLVETKQRGSNTTVYTINRHGLEALCAPATTETPAMRETPATTWTGGSMSETQGVHVIDRGVHHIDGGVHVGVLEEQQKNNMKNNQKTDVVVSGRTVRRPRVTSRTTSPDASADTSRELPPATPKEVGRTGSGTLLQPPSGGANRSQVPGTSTAGARTKVDNSSPRVVDIKTGKPPEEPVSRVWGMSVKEQEEMSAEDWNNLEPWERGNFRTKTEYDDWTAREKARR